MHTVRPALAGCLVRFHLAGATTLLLLLSHVAAAQESTTALPREGQHAMPVQGTADAEIWRISGQASVVHVQPLLTTKFSASRPWLSSRERWTAAGFIAATLVALPFDGQVARGWERPSVHRNPGIARGANVVRWLGDPGAIALTVGSYAIGRVTDHDGLADAGLHATEAVLVSGATTNLLKLAIGRARPREVAGRDAFMFRPARGTNGFASFPSGHTTAAFAAAAAISAELACSEYAGRHRRLVQAAPVVLFGVASLVGVSRMYHDAHWASDVIAGAGIGTIGGRVLVRQQHSGKARSWLDRRLLGASVTTPADCRRSER